MAAVAAVPAADPNPRRLVCRWCATVLREGDPPEEGGLCDECAGQVRPHGAPPIVVTRTEPVRFHFVGALPDGIRVTVEVGRVDRYDVTRHADYELLHVLEEPGGDILRLLSPEARQVLRDQAEVAAELEAGR